MNVRRRLGISSLLVGLAVIAIARAWASGGGPPLYDGVVPEEPYRWLVPPPGAQGDPTSFSGTFPVSNGASDSIAAATSENPPQAQLITDPGAITLTPGATSMTASIRPVPEPGPPPPGWIISGNTYQITVTDQAGTQLTVAHQVTVVMRGPGNEGGGAIATFSGGTWTRLTSSGGAIPSMLGTNADGFGDFAILAPATGASGAPATAPGTGGVPATPAPGGTGTSSGSTGGPPIVLLALGLFLAFGAVAGFILLRDRGEEPPEPKRRPPPRR